MASWVDESERVFIGITSWFPNRNGGNMHELLSNIDKEKKSTITVSKSLQLKLVNLRFYYKVRTYEDVIVRLIEKAEGK